MSRAFRFLAVLLSLTIASCSPSPSGDSQKAQESITPSPISLPDGAQECASPDTYSTIKEIIFNQAVQIAGGDPVPIHDLRLASSTRMDIPLVKGYNSNLKRAECSGRFIISNPVTARTAFSGEQELKADIAYSVQPAADGQGSVVEVNGIEYIVRSIVSANAIRSARRVEQQGGPHLVNTFNPSFGCGPRLTNTERMICQDEELSQKDRQLSSSFKLVLAASTGTDRQLLLNYQRRALAERATCAETSCLSQWYEKMLAQY